MPAKAGIQESQCWRCRLGPAANHPKIIRWFAGIIRYGRRCA